MSNHVTQIDGHQHCFEEHAPNTFNLVFGVIICLGSVVAYGLQIQKILSNRSNLGLSALSCILASVSNTATLYNAISGNWDSFLCCRVVALGKCLSLLLAFIQLCIVWGSWTTIFILYASFFSIPSSAAKAQAVKKKRMIVRGVFWAYYFVMVMGGSAMIISWNFFISTNDPLFKATDLGIGIVAAVAMGLFWMPQIWTTFKLKDAGSLSMLMLLLTTPGAYLTIYFYIAYGQTLLVIIPSFISAGCQTILFVLCIKYTYFPVAALPKKESQQNFSETTALIDDRGYISGSGYFTSVSPSNSGDRIGFSGFKGNGASLKRD